MDPHIRATVEQLRTSLGQTGLAVLRQFTGGVDGGPSAINRALIAVAKQQPDIITRSPVEQMALIQKSMEDYAAVHITTAEGHSPGDEFSR